MVSVMPADVSTSHEVAAGGTTVAGEAVHMGTDGLIYNDSKYLALVAAKSTCRCTIRTTKLHCVSDPSPH